MSAGSDRFRIAAVADGHGADECFRSRTGAEAAVGTAVETLRQFAESILQEEESEQAFYRTIFHDPRERRMILQRLADTIVAGWTDRVLEDYEENPPATEETGEMPQAAVEPEQIAHIYGTTLIAALWLPECLILLQQGDGRCDVFYEDGSVDQPIPWDERCHENVTTSMCDSDAAASFRSCVIDRKETPVMACFLDCDGVEDAYHDSDETMAGVHTFHKHLILKLLSMQEAEFDEYLEEFLPEFSAFGIFGPTGSGDDVSVAGIVDREAAGQWKDRFSLDIRRYELEEELFQKENELKSKMRKHQILKKRMDEALKHTEDPEAAETARKTFEEYDSKYSAIEDEIALIQDRIRGLESSAEEETAPEEQTAPEAEAALEEDNALEEQTILEEDNAPKEQTAPEDQLPEKSEIAEGESENYDKD
jgi:hypothetical protein